MADTRQCSVFLVDAWADDFEGWTWNQAYKLFEFRTKAANVARAFASRLRKFLLDGVPTIAGTKEHIDLGKGWYRMFDYGDTVELCRRKDGCPLYACKLEVTW